LVAQDSIEFYGFLLIMTSIIALTITIIGMKDCLNVPGSYLEYVTDNLLVNLLNKGNELVIGFAVIKDALFFSGTVSIFQGKIFE